jgi:hypothetical protein
MLNTPAATMIRRQSGPQELGKRRHLRCGLAPSGEVKTRVFMALSDWVGVCKQSAELEPVNWVSSKRLHECEWQEMICLWVSQAEELHGL